MSLLSICQSVLGEVGWPVFSQISGNTDATAVQIKAIANNELRALSEAFDWPMLETEYSFATVDGTSAYALPSDYRKVVQHSVFDASEYYSIKGSMPIAEWNIRKYGLLGGISRRSFRLNYDSDGNPFLNLTPTPSSANTLVLLYFGTDYARDAGGTVKPQYVLDTDVSRVPERMVELGIRWRFKRAKGLDHSAELAEYNSSVRQQYAARKDSPDIFVGGMRRDPDMDGLTSGYIPENGFG